MFDFVHLNWRSFKYDPPTDGPDVYLCLVYLHDIDPKGKAELQFLYLEPLGDWPDYEGEWYIQDAEERTYSKDTVIAWADTSSFTFTCDWKKRMRGAKRFSVQHGIMTDYAHKPQNLNMQKV